MKVDQVYCLCIPLSQAEAVRDDTSPSMCWRICAPQTSCLGLESEAGIFSVGQEGGMPTQIRLRGQPVHAHRARTPRKQGGCAWSCHHGAKPSLAPWALTAPTVYTAYQEETPQDLYADKTGSIIFLNSLCFDISSRHCEQFQYRSQIDGPFDGFRGWLSERGHEWL